MLQAWRQAARYTKEHIKDIQYARNPVIDITQETTTGKRTPTREQFEQNQTQKEDTRIHRLDKRETIPP